MATAESIAELVAPPDWLTLDFISDLHLHASEPATFAAWQHYMQTAQADALFILGDLFEVWVGDDALQSGSFEDQCAQVIHHTAARVPIFFMHGNRDFLAGSSLMQACNCALLADPAVLIFNTHRWLLSHGDALCIDDVDYMAFRSQVRSAQWQKTFLAKPLAERQAIARGMREQSDVKKSLIANHADVDKTAARQLLQQAQCMTLIHGHTHKPAVHDLGSNLQRVVLSDWDASDTPPRAEVLRLSAQGLQRISLV